MLPLKSVKRIAIVSDIHSNEEALEAVLEDIQESGADEILCLGDLIGYGPNPRQVLRRAIRDFRFTLLGNHEESVLFQPVGFNWKAEASAWWTKAQIASPRHPKKENDIFASYLRSMPRYMVEKDILYVHASPLDPTREYILPETSYNWEHMKHIFRRIPRVAFGGHTHLPGIFFEKTPFLPQDNIDGPFPVTKGKFFVNVGSVGQPRDGDTRACYVLFDGKTVTYRRVPYDYRVTARKIKRIKKLPNALGARLSLGV